MKYRVTVRGVARDVEVQGDRVLVDGIEHRAELRTVADTPLRLLILDDAAWQLVIESSGRHAWLIGERGERGEVEVLDERTAHVQSLVGAGVTPAGPVVLRAPMPGLVVRVLVEPGQKVLEGTSLIVLEAMKMENELKAKGRGTVELVSVAPGRAVEKGEILVTFAAT